ncbi:hypothetical protein TPHA_0H00460 [Tetrapisispora phaffii CBS 4417]|uniref:Uncharacterized protein n=1 Tax=Tetrapisispora phaffii (strain ATCC 24235 / CBS 4417 / NBRC 1672 / NRRL Y-8282 / UCD 70-5) TaxID=1071381 RepID=G8BWV2_TETPH|nr:hypothetical protein TPHA_0H00460 [Tetrapisispora phaffii CBS 4417]CCE64256.1 hypothetical protein TPHA_0H00460 [Tetrapisispora phaffii CBS 4417]
MKKEEGFPSFPSWGRSIRSRSRTIAPPVLLVHETLFQSAISGKWKHLEYLKPSSGNCCSGHLQIGTAMITIFLIYQVMYVCCFFSFHAQPHTLSYSSGRTIARPKQPVLTHSIGETRHSLHQASTYQIPHPIHIYGHHCPGLHLCIQELTSLSSPPPGTELNENFNQAAVRPSPVFSRCNQRVPQLWKASKSARLLSFFIWQGRNHLILSQCPLQETTDSDLGTAG